MVINGNVQRGLDVGLVTKAGHKTGLMRSHIHDYKGDGEPIYSRGSSKYEVRTPSGKVIWVIPKQVQWGQLGVARQAPNTGDPHRRKLRAAGVGRPQQVLWSYVNIVDTSMLDVA